MKLTESHLRNLIKQELKQFLKLNENDDLDSLDTEIPDEDEDEELSDEEIALNALEPNLDPFISPYILGNTIIVSPSKIKDDAAEFGLYDPKNPLHIAARAASRRARK